MFDAGDRVLVACSGGPDSSCLLYCLHHLRRLFKVRLSVFHFDHRLRPDSSKDAEYVRKVTARLRVPFHLRVADSAPARGASVEAWASVSRGNAANAVRKDIRANVIAEGHTLDDQAETVLLNLIRGTGLDGLAGIWPASGQRPYLRTVQPLIDVEREEVEAFCRALHLRPRRDPTNLETKYLRNALRLKGIPALERTTGREIKRPIARSAQLLRDDREELWYQAVKARDQVLAGRWSWQHMTFDAAVLRTLPRPIAARALRLAIYQIMADEATAPWTKEATDAVLDLAAGRPGRRRDLPGGLKAAREKGYVRLTRPSPGERREG